MEFTLREIAVWLKGSIQGDPDAKVHNIAKIEEAQPGDLSFVANPKYLSYLDKTQATAVIVSKKVDTSSHSSLNFIQVEDPYSAFSLLLEKYQEAQKEVKIGREEPVYLGEEVSLGARVYLGAFSYIGKGSRLGDDCKIFPQVYIGEGCELGAACILYPGVKLYPGTRLGRGCVLHSGAVLGSDGFGFAPQKDGSYKSVPQLGNVILEDDVVVGANTVIDCATLGSTLIEKGTKLDNLIQIGHNVIIGANTVIAAQAGVSGSTQVGKGSMIGGQVGLAGHLKIAEGTKIAAQSGIAKDISQPGQSWMGSPAFELKAHIKSFNVFKRLPEMEKDLRRLLSQD